MSIFAEFDEQNNFYEEERGRQRWLKRKNELKKKNTRKYLEDNTSTILGDVEIAF